MSFVIAGTGSDLPERVVTNLDIERDSLDYDRTRTGVSLDEWVQQRSGVVTRHRISSGEGTSDMAVRAAERALATARVQSGDVDLIVLGTFTSDYRLPSSVSLLARELGSRAKCLQLETACTGFIDALLVATSLMASAGYRTALVVHSEAMSALCDPQQFMYQSIFGDGAGAVVVREEPGSPYGIEAIRTHTDAHVCDWTWAPGGGTKNQITGEVLAARSQYLSLQYKTIYGYAVEKMVEATHEVLNASDHTIDDVDWLIPHQAGANIMRDVARRLKVPLERVITAVDHTGNVSGASVVIAMDEARRAGRFGPGERLLLPVVGGGMAWGALSLVWSDLVAA